MASRAMRLTGLQWITFVAIFGYLIYEFYLVPKWEAGLPSSDPVIRGDLVFIYPVLLLLTILSAVKFLRKKTTKNKAL